MDLLKQIKNWNNQGKWRKIITEVEKINPIARDPEMNLILGHAYVRLAPQSSDSEAAYRKAIKVLLPLEDVFAENLIWSFDLGAAYFYSNQYGKAIRYLNHAKLLTSDTNFLIAYQDMVSKIYRNFALPFFKKDFATRVKETWVEFGKKEAKFRRALDKAPELGISPQIFKECAAVIEGLSDSPVVHLGTDDDLYSLILEGKNLFQLFEIELFKQQMPKEISKNWEVVVGLPPGFFADTPDFPQIPTSDVKLSLKKRNGDVFWVDLYFANSPKEWGKGLEKDLESLRPVFLNTTGEIIFAKYFDFSASTGDRSPNDIRLSELNSFLKKFHIDIEADSNKQLNHEVKYRKYPNWSKQMFLAARDLRADITSGTTKIMKLLENYFGGLTGQVEDLEAGGAMAGFFFYRTDNLASTKDKRRELKKFRQSFIKELVEKAGPDKVTILGEATGKEQDYVDVLMYDTLTVIDIAAQILRDSPVTLSGFHTFRRYAGTLLFSGEDVLNAEGFLTKFGRVYGYEKESDGAVILPPISDGDDDNNYIRQLFELSTQNLERDLDFKLPKV